MSSGATRRDPTRYQGKKLAFLLLAIAIPAGLLYLRLVFGLVATDNRIPAAKSILLSEWSSVALILFFIAQLGAAAYVQQLVPKRVSNIGQALTYVGVLVLCVFFSLTGMVILEAFGVNFFLRAAAVRYG